MQSIRIYNRTPQAYRIIKVAPANIRNMSFFPRFASTFPVGEFAPLFRLMDDYASHQLSRTGSYAATHVRSYQPRFDVREVKGAYELHGELPGIDQENINIEFTDPQTLSIKGRTERHTQSGTTPAAVEAPAPVENTQASGTVTPAGSESSYHKATVEDEPSSSSAAESSEQSTTSATAAQEVATTTESQPTTVQPQQQREPSRYWVSERSVGEFHRSFSFPARVDQENVRASLKNGILSIIVPKAAAPTLKRINIE